MGQDWLTDPHAGLLPSSRLGGISCWIACVLFQFVCQFLCDRQLVPHSIHDCEDN